MYQNLFHDWEEFDMTVRNFMEIPQTAGLFGIAEENRYFYGHAILRSILPAQQIAAVHGSFRLELIDKYSWDFAAGIPQCLIASAGGFARDNIGQQQQSGQNFEGNCNYCHQYGYMKGSCPRKKEKEAKDVPGGRPQPVGPGGISQPFPDSPSPGGSE
ncbi:MAG: hypothetical protein GY696_07430, partial [Gammaproteobacteria bacterium]|nr:hypothetical protein [Gammaproteobacteria bacterium]